MPAADETESSDTSDDPDQPRPPGVPANDVAPDNARLFTNGFVRLLAMQAAYGFSFSMFFLLPKYLAATGESASFNTCTSGTASSAPR